MDEEEGREYGESRSRHGQEERTEERLTVDGDLVTRLREGLAVAAAETLPLALALHLSRLGAAQPLQSRSERASERAS